ncbi:MAG: type II secretion system protein [Cyanobacteria bacterium J06634_6]
MQLSISLFYRWLCTKHKNQCAKGFTLLELLISLVIAGMVTSGLLYTVVELTKIDKREASIDQVQRDMQRAMDYIVDDLQEAVYVYTDPNIIADQLAADDDFPKVADGAVPVLAFWRVDPIEGREIERLKDDCDDYETDAKDRICDVLKIRQASYTLVVYSQQINDPTDNKWLGQSRIIRYQLSRYTAAGLETLTERDGYRDPTKQNDPDARFEDWKVDNIVTPATATEPAVIGATEEPKGDAAVLVDFIQTPNLPPSSALNRPPLSHKDSDGNDVPCYEYGVIHVDDDDDPTTATVDEPLYKVTPSTARTTLNNTFFACVRDPDPANNTAANSNQDVYLFLRGSTQGISGGVNSFSEESSLPILETQVLVRGVIDKNI